MASDQILFDSEEIYSQNKENMNNDNSAKDINPNETDKADSTELFSDTIHRNDSFSDDQTQNSQEVLDNIARNISKRNGIITDVNSDSLVVNNESPGAQDTENNESQTESMEFSEEIESEVTAEPNINTTADTSLIDEDIEHAPDKKATSGSSEKHCTLPLSRVKLIMKTDPNVKVLSSEATILAAIAAEKFLKFIIEETARITKSKKKKTIMKQHFDEALQGLEVTEFLEGMMDE